MKRSRSQIRSPKQRRSVSNKKSMSNRKSFSKRKSRTNIKPFESSFRSSYRATKSSAKKKLNNNEFNEILNKIPEFTLNEKKNDSQILDRLYEGIISPRKESDEGSSDGGS